MGAARVVLIVLGAILTILGTYVFALFPSFPPLVGSGLGFATNLPSIITYAPAPSEAAAFYVLLVVFIIWLGAGVLMFIGLKSRVVGVIFSLVPLAIGVMFLLLVYTTILGTMTATFFLLTSGEVYFGFIPYLYELGGMGIGIYLLLAGGFLGLIGSILPKD